MRARQIILLTTAGLVGSPNALFTAGPAAGAAGWIQEYPQSEGSPARSCSKTQ